MSRNIAFTSLSNDRNINYSSLDSEFTDVNELSNKTNASGILSGCIISHISGTDISISSGRVIFKTGSTDISDYAIFDIGSVTSYTLTLNQVTYVYLDYNSGAPAYQYLTSVSSDVIGKILIGRVVWDGTTYHDSDGFIQLIGGFDSKMFLREIEEDTYRRTSGCVPGSSGLNLTLTAGVFWSGVTRIATSAIDTGASDTFTYLYGSTGSFTQVTSQTDINVAQYDNSGVLTALTSNYYRSDYIYITDESAVTIVLGKAQYATVAEAEAESVPDPGTYLNGGLQSTGILVGKLVVQQGAASLTSIKSPFESTFNFTGASDHGALAGLGDDDHTQYVTLANRTGETLDIDNVTVQTLLQAGSLNLQGSSITGDSSVVNIGDFMNVEPTRAVSSGNDFRLKNSAGQVFAITDSSDADMVLVDNDTGNITFNSSTTFRTVIDDDSMATASATALATSESIKAYVDAQDLAADTHITSTGADHSYIDQSVTTTSDVVFNSMDIDTIDPDGESYITVDGFWSDIWNLHTGVCVVSGCIVSEGSAGTVSITAGEILIRPTNDKTDQLERVTTPSVTDQAIVADTAYFIYYDYTLGWQFDTSQPTSFNTQVVAGIAVYETAVTTMHLCGGCNTNISSEDILNFWRIGQTERFKRASGLILSETGTRNIAISAGLVYEVLTPKQVAAFDSSGAGTFNYYYGSGTLTTVTGQTQIDNNQYDNGGTLATLAGNQFGVHWVYQHSDGDVNVIYGKGSYTLDEALDSTEPSDSEKPPAVVESGYLIGRIIIKKSLASFEAVQSAFTTTLGASGVSDHGELSGLADDDHTQYATLVNRGGETLDIDTVQMENLQIDGFLNLVPDVTTGNCEVLLKRTATSDLAGIGFQTDAALKWTMYMRDSSNDLSIYNDNLSSTALLIDTATSNVALAESLYIGNAAPTHNTAFAIQGPATTIAAGPHVEAYVDSDTTYPVTQQLNWNHDVINWAFDAYYTGTQWESSSSNGSAVVAKGSNIFRIQTKNTSAQGQVVVWNNDFEINIANGHINFPRVYSTGAVGGRDVYIQSDGQLTYDTSIRDAKMNIIDVTDASSIYDLVPRMYNAKKRDADDSYLEEVANDRVHIGFIADEVKSVDPNLVTYKNYLVNSQAPDDSTYEAGDEDVEVGIDKTAILAMLVKCVQDLRGTVNAQAIQIDALFEEIANMKNDIPAKEPVVCATTENINLLGLQTIDGVNVLENDRVLVKNQTDPSENGIYIAKYGSWERTDDFSGSASIIPVNGGTIHDDSTWRCVDNTYAFVEE
jgi:hypothetical protein